MKPLLLYVLLTLTITLEAALISDDFPNTSETALEINFISDINGTIEAHTDEDWFKFTLDEENGVVITAFNPTFSSTENSGIIPPPNLNSPQLNIYKQTIIILVDNSGNLIESNTLTLLQTLVSPSLITESDENISLNLLSSTYFIKVENLGDYRFNVRINGEPEPEIILDATTMQYCKEHPIECIMA